MKSILATTFALTALLLAGCTNYDAYHYQSIDVTDKSITLPPGGGYVLSEVKRGLVQGGWKVLARRGAEVTDLSSSQERRYDTYNTRYAGVYEPGWEYMAVEGIRWVRGAEISIIDNRDGSEVFSMTFERMPVSSAAKHVLTALNGNVEEGAPKPPPPARKRK